MKKKVKFGLAIPTGTEGLMVNLPYASARDVIEMSVFAEKLGFDSVWGNDHIHSQKYVLEEFKQFPRYYSPPFGAGRYCRADNDPRTVYGTFCRSFP